MNKKSISVIGMGVVGLTTAVGFALKGHKIIGIDINNERIAALNQKTCPFFEYMLCQQLKNADLNLSTSYETILDTDISFICAGTPAGPDGSIDLGHIQGSIGQMANVLKKKKTDHLIVVRSTVIPGTTDNVIAPFFRDNEIIGICANPEFFTEGKALEAFMSPNRIVIGENGTKWGDILYDLYKDFNSPILRTAVKTAEMIKYASNSFLATKISYINEIGTICKEFGIDVFDVARGMGFDDRIGSKGLRPGIGFGGYCLPKDISALFMKAKSLGCDAKILNQVIQVNNEQPYFLLSILKKHIPVMKGRTIGILGLSFKPETDDIRESRSILLVKELLKEGAKVRVYDPKAMPNFKMLFPDIEYTSPEEVLGSDAILIVTEWAEFNNLDYHNSIVIDGRRIDKAKEAKVYEGLYW
jgi:UDPglucose 6-dehydrogenase